MAVLISGLKLTISIWIGLNTIYPVQCLKLEDIMYKYTKIMQHCTSNMWDRFNSAGLELTGHFNFFLCLQMARKRPLFLANWKLSSYNKRRRVRVSCTPPLLDTNSAEDSDNCPSTIGYSDHDECNVIVSNEVTSDHGIVEVECDDTSPSVCLVTKQCQTDNGPFKMFSIIDDWTQDAGESF